MFEIEQIWTYSGSLNDQKIRSTIDKLEIKKTDKASTKNYDIKTFRLPTYDIDTDVDKTSNNQNKEDIKSDEKASFNLIKFDHVLTDFEIKLKYLNLKDINGKEYGKLFPPIKSQLVIVDNEGRKFSMTKAGVNQISGNFLSLINANNLKVGDVITIEYDRDNISKNGNYIINIKAKKDK